MNKKTLNALMALLVALTMLLGGLTAAMAEGEADLDAAFVTINGVAVTRREISAVFANMMNFYASVGYDVTDESMQQELYSYAMENAVQSELMRQNAESLGVTLTEEEKAQAQAEFDAAVADYESSLLSGIENPTDEDKQKAREDTLAVAAEQGFTVEYLQDNTLIGKVYDAVVKDVTATEEDVRSDYASTVAKEKETYANDFASYEMILNYGEMFGMEAPVYVPAGMRGIKHILLPVSEELKAAYMDAQAALEEALDEGEATEGAEAVETKEPSNEGVKDIAAIEAEILASVQPTVDEIIAKFNAGTSFDDLVKEYGTDPGMQQEPQMSEGYRLHLDSQMFDPAFKAAAFDQLEKIGDISNPVVGQSGVHILFYATDIPEGAPELTEEEVAARLSELLYVKQEEAFMAKMTEWMEASDIVYAEE